MVQSTTQQRVNYAPACKAHGVVFREAYEAKDAVFRHWAYPTNRSYTGCYACRKITGGTGYSLHSYPDATQTFHHWDGTKVEPLALAEDVNAAQNPYGTRLVTDRPRGMVDDLLAIRTNNGEQVFGWGGYYTGHKDAMHDDIVCTPAGLASGINWATVAGGTPTPTTPKDTDMLLIQITDGDDTGKVFLVNGDCRRYIDTQVELDQLTGLLGPARALGNAGWQNIVEMTALDAKGLRSLPGGADGQWQQLLDAIQKVADDVERNATEDHGQTSANLRKAIDDVLYLIDKSGFPPPPG